MCGIVHVKRKDKKPAARSVLKRYREQRARGSQGFGYVAIHDNRIVAYERSATEHEIVQKLEKEKAEEILFHHRFPTSTPNIAEQAHPLYVQDGKNFKHQYFIAHNGVIRNSDSRKERHDEFGIAYSTKMEVLYRMGKKIYEAGVKWNDSESIAVDTALFLESTHGSLLSSGTAAVIALQVQKKQVLNRFFFRNVGNPLNFYEDNNMQCWTSTGKGKELEPLTLYHLTDKGIFEKNIRPMYGPYSWTDRQAYRDSTPHYAHGNNNVDRFIARHGLQDLSGMGADGLEPHTMGFLSDGRDNELDGDTDDELSKAIDRMDMTPSLDDDAPMHFSEIEGIAANKFQFIEGMDDDTLFEEYDRTIAAVEHLTKALAKMDERMTGFDRIDDETLNARDQVYQKLESLKSYHKLLDIQVTVACSAIPYVAT